MTENTNPTYDQACKTATTNQGLDPIVALLTAEGFPVEVDQTGGFCMVVRVQPDPEGAWLGITEGDYEGTFLLCHYADADDLDGTLVVPDAPLDHVADYVRGFVRTNA